MKGRPATGGLHRRLFRSRYGIISLCLVLLVYLFRTFSGNREPERDEQHQDWAGSFLHAQADPNLNNLINNSSLLHKSYSCDGDNFNLKGSSVSVTGDYLRDQLDQGIGLLYNGKQRLIEATALSIPCG